MDFSFTHEQEMMQRMVRDFAKHDIPPVLNDMETADAYPTAVIKKMGTLGLMGIPIPEAYGGADMDFVSYTLAIEELSKVSASIGVILSVHTSVGTHPILYFGTEEQKQTYVRPLAQGDNIGAFCLTESGAGSDAGSLKTRAVKKDGYYVLNGAKMFVTNGEVADTFVVFARTDPDAPQDHGVSAFIVDRNIAGVTVGKKENKMGLHGSGTVEIVFEDACVPVDHLLGEEGKGFQIALANLDAGRIGIAAQALGIAEAALTLATDYAGHRKQFANPIGAQQAVGFKLADIATNIEAARWLLYQAAALRSSGRPSAKEASMAKLLASRVARESSIEAVQILGGYGYTKDYSAERLFRDAKVTEIYEGTSEIQQMVVSKHVLSTS